MNRPEENIAPADIARTIRLGYAQMMFNAVFAASTGGMFLIGFALALGADNVTLGLLATVPQLLVVFQFAAALLIERGVSRKKLTIGFAFAQPLCWLLIAAIPLLGDGLDRSTRFGILIGVLALTAMAGQFVANARSSWVGELIPADRRGTFFGKCAMFAGIVGAVFAIAEGRFLDIVRSHGLLMFTSLFLFGSLFGVVNAALNIPQPDCPLPGDGRRLTLGHILRTTLQNRPFVRLAVVHAVIAIGGIAGPFGPAYCLRDVGVSFFGLGLLNSITTAAALMTSSFWGRCADRFGCRPLLIVGLLLLAPCGLIWLAIPPGAVHRAYCLLPWANAVSGCGVAAVSVALTTMMYTTSKPEARSAQFAIYNSFVTLLAAPMPILGGWLVSTLQAHGLVVDLRLTFYIWVAIMFVALWRATKTEEPKSLPATAFILELSGRAPNFFRILSPFIFTSVERDKKK